MTEIRLRSNEIGRSFLKVRFITLSRKKRVIKSNRDSRCQKRFYFRSQWNFWFGTAFYLGIIGKTNKQRFNHPIFSFGKILITKHSLNIPLEYNRRVE